MRGRRYEVIGNLLAEKEFIVDLLQKTLSAEVDTLPARESCSILVEGLDSAVPRYSRCVAKALGYIHVPRACRLLTITTEKLSTWKKRIRSWLDGQNECPEGLDDCVESIFPNSLFVSLADMATSCES